jgi:hypothetical protein
MLLINAINKWIFAKKKPPAARNGYLIVRIRLLDSCLLVGVMVTVRPFGWRRTGLNASPVRYPRCERSSYRLGNSDSSAVPSARVQNAKITDHWGVGNLLSLMQQIGDSSG